MNIRENGFKFYLFSSILIFIVSFVILSPSFNLAFQDDDWRGVVLPRTDYADGRLFSPYGIQLWFCGTLYSLFNSHFYLYYVLSFILRNLASFCILVFIYQLTKNKIAAIVGGLMFAVGFSGLQTTFETANMNVYIAVIGYLIFLVLFFQKKDNVSLIYLTLMIISLVLSTLASPVRSYPLYVWVFIVDAVDTLISFTKERIKVFIIRQILVVGAFLSLYLMGIFSWFSLDVPGQSKYNNLTRFITELAAFLKGLDIQISLNFLRGLGNTILPSLLDKSGILAIALGSIYLVILLSFTFWVINKKDKRVFPLFAFLLWPLVLYAGYFVVYLSGYTSGKDTIFLDSLRRYLLPPFIGFCIASSLIISLNSKKKSKIRSFTLILALILILIHAVSTHIYLNNLSKQRDGFYMVNIWKQLKQLVPEASLSSTKTNVFYFETDGSARAIYTVNDGFIPHMIALYKIDQKSPPLTPTEISSFGNLLAPPVLSFEQIIALIKNGFPNNSEPVTWDRIFAFQVEGDRLMDIKEDLKRRVEKSLNE